MEVVRCFENANVVRYNDDPVNPKNDIDVINLELSMSDLESVNNRIGKQEKIRTHFQFGKSGSDYMRLVHPTGFEPVAF